MREYGKVAPGFWTGKTGKALKAKGPEAVIVALYLMTCQHANMLGIYYLSKTYIAVDTPLGFEGACKGLQGACEAGFCMYDEGSEVVWIMEMAAYQIAERLDEKDNRCKGIQREYDALPENPFLWPFYERYAGAFNMTSKRGEAPKKERGSKGPRKPLRSQEQEQEHEQEQDHEQDQEQEGGGGRLRSAPRAKSAGAVTFDAYAAAYRGRYHAEPLSNVKVRSQFAKFCERVPADEAPHIAAWFVGHNNSWYIQRGHSIDCLLSDAEKLRTEWVTGRQTTASAANQADRTQTNLNAFAPLIAEARKKEQEDAQRKVA